MNALPHKFPRLRPHEPRLGESQRRIRAYREDVLPSVDAVTVSPELRAGRSNFQIQPMTIGELVGRASRSSVANLRVGESQGVSPGTIPAKIPAILSDANALRWTSQDLSFCY